jgi:Polyphenol oxidase middle domain
MSWQEFSKDPKRVESLARGIAAMKKKDGASPTSTDFRGSWRYWAAMHSHYGAPSSRTVAQAIAFLKSQNMGQFVSRFKGVTDMTPPDGLAKEVWDGCKHSFEQSEHKQTLPPPFSTDTFGFVDEKGARAERSVADFLDASKLEYRYDNVSNCSRPAIPGATLTAANPQAKTTTVAVAKGINLDGHAEFLRHGRGRAPGSQAVHAALRCDLAGTRGHPARRCAAGKHRGDVRGHDGHRTDRRRRRGPSVPHYPG